MIICIAGPTGVGKTKMSIKLAKKYNAIIVNADATQIYDELNIGSDKITKEEMDGVKHYLINIKKPNEDFSIMDYQKLGRQILDDNKDKNIIVVGGTGLYIKVLFNEYEFTLRNNTLYNDLSNEELYNLAIKKDKDMQIHPNNRIRLINFLKGNNTHKGNNSLYDVIYIGLSLDRDVLYTKANNRVEEMFSNGLINEVKTLYQKYPNSNILKRAIGYKEIIEYINNNISLEEAKELIKKNTRHFIKRQYTWFNNQMNLNYFDISDFNKAYYEIIDLIESLNSK